MAKNIGTVVDSQVKTRDDQDKFPVTDSRHNLGGRHDYKSIADACLSLPHERMRAMMQVAIWENKVQGIPAKTYILKQLPYSRTSGSTEPVLEIVNGNEEGLTRIALTVQNWEQFFEIDKEAKETTGEHIIEYAKAYDSTYYDGAPAGVNTMLAPFPYELDSAWNSANWGTTLDYSRHYQKRYKYGQDSPWSRPEPLFSNSQEGDYNDIRQQFRLKTADPVFPPVPEREITLQDGSKVLNNEPAGWQNTASLPEGGIISDYNLFEINNIKNKYGQIKQGWSLRQVPLDANLYRYAEQLLEDPNKICSTTQSAAAGTPEDTALLAKGWQHYPTSKTQYRAFRADNGDGTYSSWIVVDIGNESGEYPDFVYQEFPEKLEDYIIDNPDGIYSIAMGGDGKPFRPKGTTPQNWRDAQFNPRAGYVVFVSSVTKLRDGTPKSKWADPMPVTGKALVTDLIKATPGRDFKKNAAGVYDAENITLEAYLYKGDRLLNTDAGEVVEYQWTRIYNGGGDITIDVADNFGTGRTAVINNSQVDGKAIIELRQIWRKPDGTFSEWISEITMLDVADGLNARILKIKPSDQKFIQQETSTTPAQINLRVFTENISDNNGTPQLEFTWKRKPLSGTVWETLAYQGNDLVVVPGDFSGTENQYDYSVEITDSIGTFFSDVVSVGKLSLQAGASSYSVWLSNQQELVPTHSDGTLIDATLKNQYTSYQIFEGVTEVTSQYTQVIATVEQIDSDGGTDNTVTAAVDVAAKKISITAWGKNVRAATVTIRFEKLDAGGLVISSLLKDFKLKRQKGHVDNYIATLVVTPNGTNYLPGDTTNKTVRLVAYKNGVQVADADYATYSIKFFDEFSGYNFETLNINDLNNITPVANTNSREVVIGPERVDRKNTVFCVVQFPNGVVFTNHIDITEVADAKEVMVLFHDSVTKPAAPTGLTYDAYEAMTATGEHQGYYRNPDLKVSKWKAEKRADATSWFVYQMSGEKGAAGRPADFTVDYFQVFENSATPIKPYNTATPFKTATGQITIPTYKNPDLIRESFTDNNGITWYHHSKVSSLVYNKETHRLWRLKGYVIYDINNVEFFDRWVNPEPTTSLNGVPGAPGKDGSIIHPIMVKGALPLDSLGKVTDWAFDGESWYEKTGVTVWTFRFKTVLNVEKKVSSVRIDTSVASYATKSLSAVGQFYDLFIPFDGGFCDIHALLVIKASAYGTMKVKVSYGKDLNSSLKSRNFVLQDKLETIADTGAASSTTQLSYNLFDLSINHFVPLEYTTIVNGVRGLSVAVFLDPESMSFVEMEGNSSIIIRS